MFHVICLDTGEALRTDAGAVCVYANGREASEAACTAIATTGKKHQPRPAKDDNWKEREAKRFVDGEYTRLDWDAWPMANLTTFKCYGWDEVNWLREQAHHWFYKGPGETHFAHVSSKSPGNIAFTESDEKGAADIQTSMKPGRYLARFYGEVLSPHEIEDLANEFLAKHGELEVLFASTADDMERVYTSGPNSCMSHSANDYRSPFHPVRVYAAGDLQVAYMVTKETKDQRITGRVLCWPERMVYGRVYGDDKLGRLLEGMGYSEGTLEGARVLKVVHGNVYVMPYIDNALRVSDMGDHFVIDKSGDVGAEQTHGLSTFVSTCAHCGAAYDRDDGSNVQGEEWCQSCVESGTFYCEYTEETYAGEDSVEVRTDPYRTQTWCRDAANSNAFECAYSGDMWAEECRVEMADGSYWSQRAFDRHGWECSECDARYPANDETRCGCCEGNDDGDGAEHTARQGSDDCEVQDELTLEAPTEPFPVGSRVVLIGADWYGAQSGAVGTVTAIHPKDTYRWPYDVRFDGLYSLACPAPILTLDA